MSWHYEAANIKMLESEMDMTRGVIFNQVKNKPELFNKMMDEYVFHPMHKDLLERRTKAEEMKEKSFGEFVDYYIEDKEKKLSRLQSFLGLSRKESLKGLVNLFLYAPDYYEGMDGKMAELYETENFIWQKAMEGAVARGEIDPDSDISLYVEMMKDFCLGQASFSSFFLDIDVVYVKKGLLEIYSAIRKK